MDSNNEAGTGPRTGVPTYIVEAVIAIGVVIMGIVVVDGGYKLGAGWTSDGPGAGYFPFIIGVLLCISGVGILFQALVGKTKNTDIFVDSDQLKRVLQVLIPALFYVAAVQVVGLYVASALYIALFMIFLGNYSWIKSVVVSLAVIVLFFFMFEVWFKVPLFKGMFDPLRFLGY